MTASVGDPIYDGLSAIQHAVNIADNDTAGVIITQPAVIDWTRTTPHDPPRTRCASHSEPLSSVDVRATRWLSSAPRR